MFDALIRQIAEFNWFLLVIPPLVIWSISGYFLIGFLSALKQENDRDNKCVKKLLLLGLRKTSENMWALIFTTIHLTILTIILFTFAGVIRGIFPNIPENIVDSIVLIMLTTVFFGKYKKIRNSHPTSFFSSLKFLYKGFSNPFREKK